MANIVSEYTADRAHAAARQALSAVFAQDYAGAARWIDTALVMMPTSIPLWTCRAGIALFAGDLAAYDATTREILAVDPRNRQALVGRALFGDLIGAVSSERTWRELATHYPHDLPVWRRRHFELSTPIDLVAPGGSPTDDPHTAIAVLGAGLTPEGAPTATLLQRVEHAVQLHSRASRCTVLVSGGNRRNGRTEGAVMRQLLIERGVPEAAIGVDESATNTIENAFALFDLMAGREIREITVVTSGFHARRAAHVFSSARRLLRDRLHRAHPVPRWSASSAVTPPTRAEEIATRRDILRVNGYWAFPQLER